MYFQKMSWRTVNPLKMYYWVVKVVGKMNQFHLFFLEKFYKNHCNIIITDFIHLYLNHTIVFIVKAIPITYIQHLGTIQKTQ